MGGLTVGCFLLGFLGRRVKKVVIYSRVEGVTNLRMKMRMRVDLSPTRIHGGTDWKYVSTR